MKEKDQRIKIMNEILNGIRVVKLYAWEMAFMRSVTHVRENELKYMQRQAILTVTSNILWTFAPILVIDCFRITACACVSSGWNNHVRHLCSLIECQCPHRRQSIRIIGTV